MLRGRRRGNRGRHDARSVPIGLTLRLGPEVPARAVGGICRGGISLSPRALSRCRLQEPHDGGRRPGGVSLVRGALLVHLSQLSPDATGSAVFADAYRRRLARHICHWLCWSRPGGSKTGLLGWDQAASRWRVCRCSRWGWRADESPRRSRLPHRPVTGVLARRLRHGNVAPSVQIGTLSRATGAAAGLASGLVETTREIGGAVGIAVAFTVLVARTEAAGDLAGREAGQAAALEGFQSAFLVIVAVAALGAMVATITFPRSKRVAHTRPKDETELVSRAEPTPLLPLDG